MKPNDLCPCKSGSLYLDCCKSFLEGKSPDNALQLMRSRFSAYALCKPQYIIHTTHPKNPCFSPDIATWENNIRQFCLSTSFKNLVIRDCQEKKSFAKVTFTAYLFQDQKEISFTETSIFEKVQGKWLYLSGEVTPLVL